MNKEGTAPSVHELHEVRKRARIAEDVTEGKVRCERRIGRKLFLKYLVKTEPRDSVSTPTLSSFPPNVIMRCSALRLAVYSLSKKATTSSVFSPLIQSSFWWVASERMVKMTSCRSISCHTQQRPSPPNFSHDVVL